VTIELYNQLVNLLVRQKKYPEAQAAIDQTLEQFPQNVAMLRTQYLLYDEQRDGDKVIEVLQKLIAASPEDELMLFRLGYAYGDYKEDNEKALEYYEKALEINPESFESSFNAASIYVDKADALRKEINTLTKAKKLSSADRDKMVDQSNGYLKSAETKMLKCHEAKPTDETVILYLTDIYNMLEDDKNYYKFKAMLDK